jgi:hypothetical protein
MTLTTEEPMDKESSGGDLFLAVFLLVSSLAVIGVCGYFIHDGLMHPAVGGPAEPTPAASAPTLTDEDYLVRARARRMQAEEVTRRHYENIELKARMHNERMR